MRWLRSVAARAVPSPSASDVAATLSMKSRRVVVTLRLAKGEAILARAEARTFRCRAKHALPMRAYAASAMQIQDFERSAWRMLLAALGFAGFSPTPAIAADDGLMKNV